MKRVKPLGDYHPRLEHPQGAENVSIRDFNAKYEGIDDTRGDLVSVLGMDAVKLLSIRR